jgi:hypothetical protein
MLCVPLNIIIASNFNWLLSGLRLSATHGKKREGNGLNSVAEAAMTEAPRPDS